jgi:hypothetical protein
MYCVKKVQSGSVTFLGAEIFILFGDYKPSEEEKKYHILK